MFGDEKYKELPVVKMLSWSRRIYCNGCRFDHKAQHWVIEGPRRFDKDSVINQNNTQKLETVVIDTEDFILKVENKTVKNKYACYPLNKEETEDFKLGNI
jgi:NADH-quinone oxidoreductase subunit G